MCPTYRSSGEAAGLCALDGGSRLSNTSDLSSTGRRSDGPPRKKGAAPRKGSPKVRVENVELGGSSSTINTATNASRSPNSCLKGSRVFRCVAHPALLLKYPEGSPCWRKFKLFLLCLLRKYPAATVQRSPKLLVRGGAALDCSSSGTTNTVATVAEGAAMAGIPPLSLAAIADFWLPAARRRARGREGAALCRSVSIMTDASCATDASKQSTSRGLSPAPPMLLAGVSKKAVPPVAKASCECIIFVNEYRTLCFTRLNTLEPSQFRNPPPPP
ncbi:hypothetical protein DIPPA_25118 [Diplonema papillatum]|nr:hypothetical protein DIPPA_25118 [Diplonema papillatum]